MESKKNQSIPVEYDPETHDGLLHIAGKDIIIANALQAKLEEMPKEMRKALAQSTQEELALHDFALNEGAMIIESTNPARSAKRVEGFKKGLKLLGLD
ncbi:MAG: hypothetical protein A3J96_03540 [Sulfurimonas sp. RIFOXYC2_FULL_36_7]|nr:MAG: hypothetical protein A3J96_03540 [Sulfurimonas sp. RIFOXYC2_FULL_36_7]